MYFNLLGKVEGFSRLRQVAVDTINSQFRVFILLFRETKSHFTSTHLFHLSSVLGFYLFFFFSTIKLWGVGTTPLLSPTHTFLVRDREKHGSIL